MFKLNPKQFATKNRTTILPTKLAILLNDVFAVLLFVAAISLIIMLASYNPNDNCWFRVTTTDTQDQASTNNQFGVIGAYLSDLLLSLFGVSAWWLVLGIFYLGYRAIMRSKIESGNFYNTLQVICFFLLVFGSSLFEYISNYSHYSAYLHGGYGGIVGYGAYQFLLPTIGRMGASIVAISLLIIAFSLSFSLPLGFIAQQCGALLVWFYERLLKIIWRKNSAGNDLIVGTNSGNGITYSDGITHDSASMIANGGLNLYNNGNVYSDANTQNDASDNRVLMNHDSGNNENSYDNCDTDDKGFSLLLSNLKKEYIHNSAKEQRELFVGDDKIDTTNATNAHNTTNTNNVSQNDSQSVAQNHILKHAQHDNKENAFQGNNQSNPQSNNQSENQSNNTDTDISANSLIHDKRNKLKATNRTNSIQGAPFEGVLQLLPQTALLSYPKNSSESIPKETIEYISTSIENKLAEFGVEAKVVNASGGPVITRYEIVPSRGVRGDKIVGLAKEIARGLALTSVRIVETIPGKNSMGIEVPNFKRQIIYLKEIFDSPIYRHNLSKLTLALGKDITGEVVVADLAKMPHLLVAGTTGSGKSVAVNAMILSILFQATPSEVKFIMIDPKMVELSFYQDIPHLLAPVVTNMQQATNALRWVVGEMERRYAIMARVGCKNINLFNQKIAEAVAKKTPILNPFATNGAEELQKWPFIVVIIDELADLMMVTGKKIEQFIARIAQKARAVGIHLIVATQRPSVDVITGLIKANIPARISFQVSTKVDSRTILDQMGAETLLGLGDMLFLKPGSGFLQRIHGAFVNDDELVEVVEFLKAQMKPEYVPGVLTGECFGAAATYAPSLEDGSYSGTDANGGGHNGTNGADNSSSFAYGGYGSNDDGYNVNANDDTEKDEIFDEAVKFIYDSKRCSISSLQTRFGIGYNRAARIMAHLEQIGLVKRNDKGGFALVVRDSQA